MTENENFIDERDKDQSSICELYAKQIGYRQHKKIQQNHARIIPTIGDCYCQNEFLKSPLISQITLEKNRKYVIQRLISSCSRSLCYGNRLQFSSITSPTVFRASKCVCQNDYQKCRTFLYLLFGKSAFFSLNFETINELLFCSFYSYAQSNIHCLSSVTSLLCCCNQLMLIRITHFSA